MEHRRSLVVGALGLAGLLALASLTLANYRFARANPGGSDFLPSWVACRLLLTKGWSPYGEQVKAEIQHLFYGSEAPVGREILFVYPLHLMVVLAPFAVVREYELARASWMTFLEVALVSMASLSVFLMRWKIPRRLLIGFLVFSVLWYHALRPLINGNVVVVCGLFVVLGLTMIRLGQDVWAGLFLALATMKPNILILLFVFVVLWAISRRRWRLVVAVVGFVLLLVAAGMLVIPDWLIQNLRMIKLYDAIPLPGSPGEALARWLPKGGNVLGWALTLSLAAALVHEWWRARGKDFSWFLWTACLTLAINQWIGIKTDPGNFLIFFPALVLIFATWEARWGQAGRMATGLSLLFLGVGLWALFIVTLTSGAQPEQSEVMFFPLPLFVLSALYSVRPGPGLAKLSASRPANAGSDPTPGR